MMPLSSWLRDRDRRWRLGVAGLCLLAVGYAEYALLAQETRDVEARGRKPLLVRELGYGAVVAQTFTMTCDGLEAVGVRFWTSRPASLRLAFELLQQRGDSPDAFETIYRATTVIEKVSGTQWRTIRFAPVAASANRVFQIRLQLQDVREGAGEVSAPAPGRPDVGMMAWADNPLRLATLLIDGREQWGDLMFFARGTGRTRYERLRLTVLSSLPPPLRQPGVQLLLLLLYNLALASIVYTAIPWAASHRTPPATERPIEPAHGPHATRPRGRWTRVLGAAAAMAVVLGGLGGAVRYSRDITLIDLMDGLDTAAKDSPRGLHGAFDLVEETINGLRLPGIFAHPPSRIAWDVEVPARSALRTYLALVPGIWEQNGDGVTFRIGVTDGPAYRELFTRHVNPKGRLEDRAWIPVDIDLSAYAGHKVALVFETSPGPAGNVSYDWALWGEPRIVRAR